MGEVLDYKIDIDTKEVVKAFRDWRAHLPRCVEMILKRTGERIAGDIKAKYLTGQSLNVGTGRLRNSIGSKMIGREAVDVGSLTEIARVVYAAIHEFGGEINPKNAKMLSWIGKDGKRVFAKKVVMPASPYVRPAIDKYFSSGRAKRMSELTIQQYINRDFG